MRRVNSILVPVDFSRISANAFRYALRLADHLDASIDLLHVVPSSDGSLVSISLNSQLIGIGKDKLTDMFTREMTAVATKLEHVPAVRSFAKEGNLRSVIRQHVKEERNDLIVMGTHKENDDVDDIFGTNTSLLVSNAPCPVLAVPEGFTFQPLQSICYATDLSHVDAFHAGHLLKVLRVFRPRLDFVHVNTGKSGKTKFNMDLLRDVFDRPDTGVDTGFHILEDDDVAEELFEFAEKAKSDLVVMHRPRRGWLGRLFGKSNTREAVLEATIPLLILPQGEGEEPEVE
ncbi:universal stress protein [Neolewinella aurantiaca]|uniref:Universal stress protein n=1 Tax=Neolewinella aurantiaca TaxID=2602767 RepID=A0A5C7FV85_9BACT|nr:universal stress protein [Neolewinella aurantiaca]TXF90262.1 universal stress protein [Neolewinella aurantiaca]